RTRRARASPAPRRSTRPISTRPSKRWMKFRSRGRACSALPIILALGVGACHVTPRPGRPQLSTLQQLQHDIDAILAAPAFEHSVWGVLVTSLSNGDTLYSVNNPTLFFVTVLRTALIAHGIDVRGPAVDVDEAGDPPARERAQVLMSHQSPPLSALATTL